MAVASIPWASRGYWPWLRSQGWDLTFIILSSVLVSVPLVLHYWIGVSTEAINIIVAGLVGGPHMYSTFTLTFWEPSFWRRYPLLAASAFLIPAGVAYLALTDLTLLLFIFLSWASFHVLQQVAWLADCYRAKAGEAFAGWSRAIDYAALFVSLYPVAVYRLVTDNFRIENEPVFQYFPVFFKTEWFLYLVWGAFCVAVGMWLMKTVDEYRRGVLNYPKTMLIGVTVMLSFIIPSFENLDVAFQGMNTWHSFQYLALLWYINRLRQEEGEISSGLVRRLVDSGKPRRFYAFHVGLTVLAGAAIMALYWGSAAVGWSLRFEQCYFTVVLGVLLMHYYFDTFFFTQPGVLVRPVPGAAAR